MYSVPTTSLRSADKQPGAILHRYPTCSGMPTWTLSNRMPWSVRTICSGYGMSTASRADGKTSTQSSRADHRVCGPDSRLTCVLYPRLRPSTRRSSSSCSGDLQDHSGKRARSCCSTNVPATCASQSSPVRKRPLRSVQNPVRSLRHSRKCPMNSLRGTRVFSARM